MNAKRAAGANTVAYGRSDRLNTFQARRPRLESSLTQTPQQARATFAGLFGSSVPGPIRPPLAPKSGTN